MGRGGGHVCIHVCVCGGGGVLIHVYLFNVCESLYVHTCLCACVNACLHACMCVCDSNLDNDAQANLSTLAVESNEAKNMSFS